MQARRMTLIGTAILLALLLGPSRTVTGAPAARGRNQPADSGPSTRDLLEAGTTAIRESNFPRAAARFREALAIDSRLLQAHFGLGLAALGERDKKGAEKAFKEALKISGNSPEVLYTVGVARFAFRDMRGAEWALSEATEADIYFAEAWYALGIVLSVRGDLQGSLTALRESLRIDNGDAATRYQFGAVLAVAGNLDVALAELSSALLAAPDLIDARPEDPISFSGRTIRAAASREAGVSMPLPVLRPSIEWPRARYYTGLVSRQPDVPDWYLYYRMALLLEDESHWRSAVQMLERAVASRDRSGTGLVVSDRLVDYSPHFHLAQDYYRLGNFREAFLHLGLAKNEGNAPREALGSLEVLIRRDRLRPRILLHPIPDRTRDETLTIRGVILSDVEVQRVEVGVREAIIRPASPSDVSALLSNPREPAAKHLDHATLFEVPGYRLGEIGPNRIAIRPVFRDKKRNGDLIEVMIVRMPPRTDPGGQEAAARGGR